MATAQLSDMAKRRKPRTKAAAARPAIKAPAHLAPEHQRLYLLMNDADADLDDRMGAAIILAPIMHRPMPPRVLTPDEAQAHAAYVEALLGGRR